MTFYRSDVLGQFMPMVGYDWSHIGVAHLFSAIKVCVMYLQLAHIFLMEYSATLYEM